MPSFYKLPIKSLKQINQSYDM